MEHSSQSPEGTEMGSICLPRGWAGGKGHGKGLGTGTARCDCWDGEATTARCCQGLVKTQNKRGGDGDYRGRRKLLSQQPQA